jgi:hypothetical protein
MARIKKGEKKKGTFEKPMRLWIVLFLIGLLTLICFRNVLSGERMIYGSDQLIAGYMFKSFAKDYIASHQSFPMWNPYIFGGLPYIDAFHGDVFYYTWLLRLILPVHSVMAYIFILQVFLAGIGMFLFLRSFKINQYGSLVVSIAYMFTGALLATTYAGHDGKAIIVSFLPWVFFFLNKGFDTKKFLYFVLGSLVIGACLLSPHVQMTYYLLMATFCYFVFRLVFLYRDERRIGTVFKISGFFVIMIGLGFLISAVQFLPALSYLPFSPRGGIGRGYSFATSWSLPKLELFDLITPHFSGLLDNYWGTNYFKQHTEYLGILPLLLAGIAIIYRMRDRYVKFFTGLGLFGILMALGGQTPFYKIPYYLFPLLKKFRAPGMIFFIASFSLCVLAAFGIQFLIEKFKEEQNRKFIRGLIITVGIVGVIGLIGTFARDSIISFLRSLVESNLIANYGRAGADQKLTILANNYPTFIGGLWKAIILLAANGLLLFLLARKKLGVPAWAGITGLVLLFDLWTVDAKFIQTVEPPREFYPVDEVVTSLQQDTSLYRVFPFQLGGQDIYRHDDYLMLYKIQSVGGYHGNQLNRYQEFIGAKNTIMFQNPENLYYRNFLDLLNVKYVIGLRLPEDLSQYDERTKQVIGAFKQYFSQPNFQVTWQGHQFAIYENLTALPRAFLVPNYTVMNETAILPRLRDNNFDPRKLVILEEKPETSFQSDTGAVGTCQVTSYDANKIVVQATLRSSGILVLSENYYPAWKASVDGKPTKIYRTDYLFRGVLLDKGDHRIEFVFKSAYYKLGGLISIFASLVILLVVIINVSRIKRKRRIEP